MSWCNPSVILTAVIAGCTIVYVFLTAFIWRATLQNTKATREIIQSAYRPYVNVSKVELDRIRLPGPEVIVTVRNKGTVPARRISSTIELRAAGGNQTVSSGKEVFLGPDSEFHISIGLNAATLPINSAPGFQIVINVSYDGAGKDHYTASGTYDYKGTSHGFSMSEGRMD